MEKIEQETRKKKHRLSDAKVRKLRGMRASMKFEAMYINLYYIPKQSDH